MKGVARQEGGWCQAVERGGGWNQHHIGIALRDAPQGGQAFADEILVGRKAVVGQCFPVWEQHAAQVGGEERHFVLKPLGIDCIGSDDGDTLVFGFFARAQLCEQQSVCRADRAGHGKSFAGTQ